MSYAMLNNPMLRFAPNPMLHNGRWIGNPPPELYLELGYKPVVWSEQPEPTGDGYYAETWTETDAAILQSWRWVDDPEISDAEALDIMLGGAEE